MVKKILNWVFGTRRVYHDPFFGKFESQRIKKEVPGREYTWHAEFSMPNGGKGSLVTMDGSYEAPFSNQLSEVQKIIETLPSLYAKMDLEVQRNNFGQLDKDKLIVKDWNKEYFLEWVYPNEVEGEDYGMCFNPFDEETGKLIFFDYVRGEIKHFKC